MAEQSNGKTYNRLNFGEMMRVAEALREIAARGEHYTYPQAADLATQMVGYPVPVSTVQTCITQGAVPNWVPAPRKVELSERVEALECITTKLVERVEYLEQRLTN